MKGLFIPEITAEMFRNGCLESIEALMAEGEIYDIEYEPQQRWIPCSERLPEKTGSYLVTIRDWNIPQEVVFFSEYSGWKNHGDRVIAWQPLPESYREGEEC